MLPRLSAVSLSLALLLFLGGAASPARAQESETVSLGPGLLTFEDIAAQLSTSKQPIRCRASIAHRAAFVYLKNRTRTEARELLATGLDLAFRTGADPRDKNAVVMDMSPEVERLERRWRRLLADNLLRAAQADWKAVAAAAQLGEADRAAQEEEIKKQLEPLEAKRDPADADRIRTLRKKRDALSAAKTNGPVFREANSFLESHFNLEWIVSAFDTGSSYRFLPLTATPSPWVTAQIDNYQKRASGFISPGSTFSVPGLIGGWTLWADAYTIRVSLLPYLQVDNVRVPPWAIPLSMDAGYAAIFNDPEVDGDSPQLLPGTRKRSLAESIFLGMPDTTTIYPGLGKDATDWFRAARTETARVLDSPRATALLTEKGKALKDIGTYSQVVATWCARQNGEAVIELWPRLDTKEPRSLPLADTLKEGTDWTLARIFQGTDWQLQEQKGAILVKPLLAFVHRPRRNPVAPAVRLIDAMQKRKEKAQQGSVTPEEKINPTTKAFLKDLPTYSEISAYAEAAAPYQPWGTMGPASYYGLNLANLDKAEPGLFLYRRLSTEQKNRLENDDFLSLADLTPAQRTALLTMLRERFLDQQFYLLLPSAESIVKELRLNKNLSVQMPEPTVGLEFDTNMTWR